MDDNLIARYYVYNVIEKFHAGVLKLPPLRKKGVFG
jgi:hypothetical protein